jgi:hypothetical protein
VSPHPKDGIYINPGAEILALMRRDAGKGISEHSSDLPPGFRRPIPQSRRRGNGRTENNARAKSTNGAGAQSHTSEPLIPDREMLAQFAGLMFKHARPDGFISLRAFPDKGSKKEKPIFIEAIRIDDGDFLAITVERARQAAAWHEAAVFCPPVATFKNHANAKTENLYEGPGLSTECDQNPREARRTLERLLGPATVVGESGGEANNRRDRAQGSSSLAAEEADINKGRARTAL